MSVFAGFPAEAFAWFAGLEADNSRDYFRATRDRFETTVRDPMEAMLDELRGEFGGELRLFRQHRDVRFSADKSPYKTRTYGVLYGAPGVAAGLYAELSARGLYAGTGHHVLGRDQLDRFRAAVADDRTGPELVAATGAAADAGLEIVGQALRTAPRGYPADHPRIELLRHKALVAGRRLQSGPDGIRREAALDHAADVWRAAAPMNAWLAANVGPSELPRPARGRR